MEVFALKFIIVLALTNTALGLDTPVTSSRFSLCDTDAQCSSLVGSVCSDGDCVCPSGTQPVNGGTRCGPIAPYFTSTCFEDFQCSRLSTNYNCKKQNVSAGFSQIGTQQSCIQRSLDAEGTCSCKEGFHYLHGRCWPSIDLGETCTRDEECLGIVRDPFSHVCVSGVCACGEGYYSRQIGECRKVAKEVGDTCVLNDDCQFEGGFCVMHTFQCGSAQTQQKSQETTLGLQQNNVSKSISRVQKESTSRQLNQDCDSANLCAEDLECHLGVCICKRGYYADESSAGCNAELGSPSTKEQCVGVLATVVDGVCTCPNNFYFDQNMRDCIKVARTITDSCIRDESCHTFGTASVCGEPDLFQLRTCECNTDVAVWDPQLNLCRFFSGLGEVCEEDNDCLAGDLTIQCVANDTGLKVCTCPENYIAVDGLCLTVGLGLDDLCQATAECTATANLICEGRCVCSDGYQPLNGTCAPIIGGTCSIDSDCVVANTVCVNHTGSLTCQCDGEFVNYDGVCWPRVEGHLAACNVSAQCFDSLGDLSSCTNNLCQCNAEHHFRDGRCWPMTQLFQTCSRSSECYLSQNSDMVVCRNGYCECDFAFGYDEELKTCTSSANFITSSFLTIFGIIFYLVLLR